MENQFKRTNQRNYFFDVNETEKGYSYVKITQSKYDEAKKGYDRISMYVSQKEIGGFIEKLTQALANAADKREAKNTAPEAIA